MVIDNSEGRADSEFSEISISRRIERNGEGEYRLNGARCRLADVVEALSDTNLGREMHSVISQGKVEAIVSSKPRDRRLLIEEAAGLGKHRKRRRRAQLKLERTRDNLERALDVEREARSRLRPLKRQAEAAERTAKLVRQSNELRAQIVADDLRSQQEQLTAAEAKLAEARATRDSVEKRFEEVRARRTAIEERIAAGEEGRAPPGRAAWPKPARPPSGSAPGPSPSTWPSETCAAPSASASSASTRSTRSPTRPPAPPVSRSSRPSWPSSARTPRRRASGCAARPRRPSSAVPPPRRALEPLERAEEEIGAALRRATQMHEMARAEAQKASERRAALTGELAAVEAKLAAAAVEGEHEALAGMLEAGSGLERAVSAVLGERLRASIVGSVGEGRERLAGAEGAARALVSSRPTDPAPSVADGWRAAPARPDRGTGRRRAGHRAPARRCLAGGRSRRSRRRASRGRRHRRRRVLRRRRRRDPAAPREGTDPALAARSEREELASRLAQREQTEERARRDLERAESALAEAAGPRGGVPEGDPGRPPGSRRGCGGGEPDGLARRARTPSARVRGREPRSSAPSSRPS